jgi:endonuclease/exonuclease/phosphatase (EEP) superfamily protein YafD
MPESSPDKDTATVHASPTPGTPAVPREDGLSAVETSPPRAKPAPPGWPLWLALTIVVILFGNWLLPRLVVAFDLAGTFQLQLVLMAAALAVVQVWRGHWRSALLILLLLAWPASHLLIFYLPLRQPESVTRSIRVMAFNVLESNQKYEETLALIDRLDPDVIGLVEFDVPWEKAFAGKLDAKYPHQVGPFLGNVIYSKFPFDRLTTPVDLVVPRLSPCAFATFSVDGQPVYFMLVHTSSPKSVGWMMERNSQINGIQKSMLNASAFRHVVVAGDFNASTHSHAMEVMIRTSGLRDTRRGYGLLHSWPTWFWPLSTCIDHCFVSDGVRVEDRRCGPSVGSDHLPVIVDLSFAHHPHLHKR